MFVSTFNIVKTNLVNKIDQKQITKPKFLEIFYSYKNLWYTENALANIDTQDTGKDEASVSGENSKTVTSGQQTPQGMITFH